MLMVFLVFSVDLSDPTRFACATIHLGLQQDRIESKLLELCLNFEFMRRFGQLGGYGRGLLEQLLVIYPFQKCFPLIN